MPTRSSSRPTMRGRPVYATDVSDPLHPVPCPKPIDLGRNDGRTDYAHDVQVDAMGIAWALRRRRDPRLLDERPPPQPRDRRGPDRNRLRACALCRLGLAGVRDLIALHAQRVARRDDHTQDQEAPAQRRPARDRGEHRR